MIIHINQVVQHSPSLTWNPKNDAVGHEFPFLRDDFQVPC